MLDVATDTFTEDFLSSLVRQDAALGLDAAIQKPLPESPNKGTGVIPNTGAQEISSEPLQQPTTQPCGLQQNDESSVSTQESLGTGSPEAQRSETPSSLDEGKSSEKAEELTEVLSSLWTEKEEHVNLSTCI